MGGLHWWDRVVCILGGEASSLFNVFEKGDEFVFKVGGGIFMEELYRCWYPEVVIGLC